MYTIRQKSAPNGQNVTKYFPKRSKSNLIKLQTGHQPPPLSAGHAETRTEVGDTRDRSDRHRGGGRWRGGGLGPGRAGGARGDIWHGGVSGGLWCVLAIALGEGLLGRTWKLAGCSCVWSVASKNITAKKAVTFVPGENVSESHSSETCVL